MNRSAITISALFILGLVSFALADDYIGPVVEDNGHYYAKVLSSSEWSTARDEAAALTYTFIDEADEEQVYPGHLAVITNQRERDAIMTLGADYNRAWIGGVCDSNSGIWRWITGEPWIYTSWVIANDEAGQCITGETIAHINWSSPWYYQWIGWESIWPDSQGRITSSIVEFEPPTLACIGFESPMDSGAVKVSKKRALQLDAQLSDGDGIPLTDVNLAVPPVLQVIYNSVTVGEPVDVTESMPAVGLGMRTPGNQFTYNIDKWQVYMETNEYTAPGTYTLKMVAGDSRIIRPTCEAEFVVE